MTRYEENIYNKFLRADWSKKYQCAGIYGIKIDSKIVYIGKSDCVLRRMAQHYAAIAIPKGKANKYSVLSQAKKAGHKVSFQLLYEAQNQYGKAMQEEIGEKEGFFIRAYMPPLNTQIPHEDNWHCYDTNKNASTVTLDDILREVKK